jgi:hypothetical protein
MPTFGKLYKELLELGSQDTGGKAESIAKAAMLRTYRRILKSTSQTHANREFSLTTNTTFSQYGLPLYVDIVINIEDGTNQKSLVEITGNEYDDIFPGNTDTGDPDFYYKLGRFGVQIQPAVAGLITVVGDSTSDTTTTYVTIHGFDANAMYVSQTLTMNGTTNVTSTQAFTTIERVVKTQDDGISWVGNVIVSDSSANVLARIPKNVESPDYQWIEFYFKPGTALTYTVRANAFKPDLVDDVDWPDFHEDYHDLLIYGAAEECFPAFGKGDDALMFGAKFRDGIKEYKGNADASPNLIHTMRDVTMGASLPHKPWIPGVDRGLAASQ